MGNTIKINEIAFHGHVQMCKGGRRQLCADIGMSRETLRKKVEGEVSFKFSDINRLAGHFGIDASDLIDFNNKP